MPWPGAGEGGEAMEIPDPFSCLGQKGSAHFVGKPLSHMVLTRTWEGGVKVEGLP